MALSSLLLALFPSLSIGGEILIHGGTLRVQAVSPTLVRLEPKGPRGFEDRMTFMVASRNFSGIPIHKESEDAQYTVLATDYYKIYLQNNVGVYWYITDVNGTKLFEAADDLSRANVLMPSHLEPNKLHWPAPLEKKSYALVDSPRFYAPPWGPTPMPEDADVDVELVSTNGFDFRNDVDGDTYVFLLGDTVASWEASRAEFLELSGPCPLLPDWAFGTWFTRWHNYTQAEAKAEVLQWDKLKLPIDVWGLDMNWRNTSSVNNQDMSASVGNSDGSDWYYDHPDTVLFPDYKDWFGYLRSKGLKTYFNDHPYPVASRGAGGLQTSPEEVSFRWQGLTQWLDEGLSLWWFDRNWRFSIPPPMVNTSRTGASWEGLDNAVWGSYVFYKTAEVFDRTKRSPSENRSISLTKFSPIDWRAGSKTHAEVGDPVGQQEHPAHHRFPVWWTGDGVPLRASVQSMVNAGVHDFKPYVHSDCGGDYRGSGGDLLRWTAHCAFGTILRFHGSDHRPWSYDEHVTGVVKQYLDARYKLMPSLIAAGQRATTMGFPLAARGDMYWPELTPDSASSDQYIFLEDILVAPIWDSKENETSRSVWIPPGSWEDAWDGSVVTGPKAINVTQPYERQPMWHRRDGGLVVLAANAESRVDLQDWSTLVLEAFPNFNAPGVVRRSVFERNSAHRTDLEFSTSKSGEVALKICKPEGGQMRAWTLRLHLLPMQSVENIVVDGKTVEEHVILAPATSDGVLHFPFDRVPAPNAGPVVEVQLAASGRARSVQLSVLTSDVIV